MPQDPLMGIKGLRCKLFSVRSALTVVVMLLFSFLAARGVMIPSTASVPTGTHRTYTTSFPLTENPISEGGKWTNGQTEGLDWANVRTTSGFAFGTQAGGLSPEPQKYNDSAALLTGAWGPNQTAQATVHAVNQDDQNYEEVELRLRSSFSAHSGTGYEILFRSSKSAKAYCSIVRWNGPLGSFTYLAKAQGSQFGVANGDVVKATIVGNAITAYINGVQVLYATDNTFSSGSPGIGFYLEGSDKGIWGIFLPKPSTRVTADYGFSSFTASDN